MRGPSPAPTALKLLKGVRPARINKNEPKPPAITGAMPKGWALHMSETAKRFWKKNAPALARIGLLTEVDLEAFRAMAEIYAKWISCSQTINKKGISYTDKFGETKIRPELHLANKLESQFMAYCRQFGMVPAERGRTTTGGGKEEEDDGDLD